MFYLFLLKLRLLFQTKTQQALVQDQAKRWLLQVMEKAGLTPCEDEPDWWSALNEISDFLLVPAVRTSEILTVPGSKYLKFYVTNYDFCIWHEDRD